MSETESRRKKNRRKRNKGLTKDRFEYGVLESREKEKEEKLDPNKEDG